MNEIKKKERDGFIRWAEEIVEGCKKKAKEYNIKDEYNFEYFFEESEDLYYDIVDNFEDKYCPLEDIELYFNKRTIGVLLLSSIFFNPFAPNFALNETAFKLMYIFSKKHDMTKEDVLRILNANRTIKNELLDNLKYFIKYQDFFKRASEKGKMFYGDVEDLGYMYNRKIELFNYINQRVMELINLYSSKQKESDDNKIEIVKSRKELEEDEDENDEE